MIPRALTAVVIALCFSVVACAQTQDSTPVPKATNTSQLKPTLELRVITPADTHVPILRPTPTLALQPESTIPFNVGAPTPQPTRTPDPYDGRLEVYTFNDGSGLFFTLLDYPPCVTLREQVGVESYYNIVDNNVNDIWDDAKYEVVTQQSSLEWDPPSVRIGDADSIFLEDVPIVHQDLVEEIGNRIAAEICRPP